MNQRTLAIAAAAALCLPQTLDAQGVSPAAALSYADLADLALAAPVVAHVRVDDADLLSDRETSNVPAGHRRFLIEADVVALIRGEDGLPAQVSYLVDLPDDARGRRARVRRGTEYLIVASRVPGRPGELRLAAPDAQLAFSPVAAERLRSILRESLDQGAPPPITGIGRAFHVPGSLPGESETQIFLQTADNRPISLIVLRRPGERPRWSAAVGDVIGDVGAPPRPDSLLWYRLACTLPPALPAQSLAEAGPDEARSIRADYRLVIEGLGPCVRHRARR